MNFSSHPQAKNPVTPFDAAGQSPLGGQLFFLLTRMERESRTRMQAVLTELQLDIRQYSALGIIADGHRPAQTDLARILCLDPSQIVTLSKELAARGLVDRETMPQDRRAKALVITNEGKARYQQAAAKIAQLEEALTASLSRRDRNALKALLERILPSS